MTKYSTLYYGRTSQCLPQQPIYKTGQQQQDEAWEEQAGTHGAAETGGVWAPEAVGRGEVWRLSHRGTWSGDGRGDLASHRMSELRWP